MPLKSLTKVIKQQFLLYFLLPVILLVLLIFSISIIYSLHKKNAEDIAYVETIKIPLLNSINTFQTQDVNLLLTSISEHRKWTSAYLLSDDGIVLNVFPVKNESMLGSQYKGTCSNSIVLNNINQNIGTICYKRSLWNMIDSLQILLLIWVLLFVIFVLFFYHSLNRKIDYFLQKLTIAVDGLQNSFELKVHPVFEEEKIIFDAIFKQIKLVEEVNLKEIQNVKNSVRGQLASQLAHDIRSPLSALNMAMDSVTQFPADERKIITNAIQRINDIANDLLKKGKQESVTNELVLSLESITNTVEQIVSEKQIQFKNFSNIVFEFDINNNSNSIAQVNPSELQRVISNLINNAVEAFENKSGKIIVTVKNNNDQVEILIKDNGKGIPAHIIKQVGQEGFSYGKDLKSQSGSGLGLFHAKQTIEKFNGKLVIESHENVGTTILIQLPLAETAAAATTSGADIILLDNDPLVRMTWEMKAKKNNKKILCLASYAELKTHLSSLDHNTIFYIDVHIADSEDGVQVAKELFDQGFLNLYLATGYEPEKFSHVTWIKGVVGKTPVV